MPMPEERHQGSRELWAASNHTGPMAREPVGHWVEPPGQLWSGFWKGSRVVRDLDG